MDRVENKDTRYFLEIDLESLKITKCSYEQKEDLDKGRQINPKLHRLFITKGQYSKFVSRCSEQLEPVLE